MSEKLSEKHLRAQKVAALKERLIDDINNAIFINVQNMELEHLHTSCSESVMPYVEVLHKLGVLKNRLEHDDGLFMRYSYSDEQQDLIDYEVSEETLDWMVQNESLLSDILYHVERSRHPIENVLCDKFFDSQVFGFWEKMSWRNQKEKEAENGDTVEYIISDATARAGEMKREEGKEVELG